MNLHKLTEIFVTGFASAPIFVAPDTVNYFMASKPGQVGKTILTLTGGETIAVSESPEDLLSFSGFSTYRKAEKRGVSGPPSLDGRSVWLNVQALRVVRPDGGRKLSTVQFRDGSQLHVNELAEYA